MSAVVRIAEELLPYLDAAIEQIRDEFGVQRFKSRVDVVNEAVKEFLKKHSVELEISLNTKRGGSEFVTIDSAPQLRETTGER